MTTTSEGCASSTRLASAGERAAGEAVRLWESDIYDPARSDSSPRASDSRAAISDMLKACGWSWEIPYRGDGQVEWCGIFAGTCWRAAGLDPRWLATYFASTYRLDLWGRYRSFSNASPNPRPEHGPFRLICNLNRESTRVPFAPQAGDILMVGDGSPEFGDHIALVESFDEAKGLFQTVEGNGNGLGPDGKRRQGVVRATRTLGGSGYCARRLIRPAPSDLL